MLVLAALLKLHFHSIFNSFLSNAANEQIEDGKFPGKDKWKRDLNQQKPLGHHLGQITAIRLIIAHINHQEG